MQKNSSKLIEMPERGLREVNNTALARKLQATGLPDAHAAALPDYRIKEGRLYVFVTGKHIPEKQKGGIAGGCRLNGGKP